MNSTGFNIFLLKFIANLKQIKKKVNSVVHSKTCGVNPDHELNQIYYSFPIKFIEKLKIKMNNVVNGKT
jgi:hypothetical protein